MQLGFGAEYAYRVQKPSRHPVLNFQWESAPEYSSARSIQMTCLGAFRVSELVYLVPQLLLRIVYDSEA